jgi:hypothetical protein
MKIIRKIIFNVLLGLSTLGILVFVFGIINTNVSLKYETDSPKDCISLVSGQDLCFTIQILEGLVLACLVTIIILLIFRKRILK